MSDSADPLSDFHEFLFFEASGGHGRSPQSDTTGVGRFLFIVRDRILVDGDIDLIECRLELLACQAQRTLDISQHHVVVRTAGDDPEAFFLERFT